MGWNHQPELINFMFLFLSPNHRGSNSQQKAFIVFSCTIDRILNRQWSISWHVADVGVNSSTDAVRRAPLCMFVRLRWYINPVVIKCGNGESVEIPDGGFNGKINSKWSEIPSPWIEYCRVNQFLYFQLPTLGFTQYDRCSCLRSVFSARCSFVGISQCGLLVVL